MNALMNSDSDNTMAPTTASSCDRSASGEMRSFSRNWRRNSLVRTAYGVRILAASTLRTHGGEVRQVSCQLLRILANHQLGEHAFERTLREQGPQPHDRVVCDDISLVEHDHLVADALDHFEDVRAVE